MFVDSSGLHQKMNAAFKAPASKEREKYSRVYRDTQEVIQKVPFGRFLNEKLTNLGISQA